MPTITDIRELKSELEIDPSDTSEDKKLMFLIEQASKWIEEYLGRANGLFYRSRTEYYGGTNTQKLLLKARPVYIDPTIQVFVDWNGFFGSTSGAFAANTELTYGEDFCLQIDQVDGVSSRSGILLRMRNVWERPNQRQGGYLSPFVGQNYGSIKVVYSAGYTIDELPANFRLACNLLVAKLRQVLPLGQELNSESYEDRSVGYLQPYKNSLMTLAAPLISTYRNWKFS